MGLPSESDNFEGYRNSDLTLAENLENMRNKEFLIVHGLADNVVPFQHSMLLARSLQKNDILFQQLVSIFEVNEEKASQPNNLLILY